MSSPQTQTQPELRPPSTSADASGPKDLGETYIRFGGERFDLFVVARGEAILEGKLIPTDLIDAGLEIKTVSLVLNYVHAREGGLIPEPPAGWWVG